MQVSVSIIIPCYNEAKYLPDLLDTIKRQTLQPKEVIVVDAFSKDTTVQIVKKYNYKLIRRKKNGPAYARNCGAKIASGKILLFLDADVILNENFLEDSLAEIVQNNVTVASCFVKPISFKKRDVVLHEMVNAYLNVTKKFYPHAPGFCIFVYKKFHEKIGGFDERLFLCEDHDYVQRAAKIGKFELLRSHKISVSIRRLAEEGRWTIAKKYIYSEIHLLFLGKIKNNIYEYKFGDHYE